MSAKTCSVEGCQREVLADGYCTPHLKRVRRYGGPLAFIPVPDSPGGESNGPQGSKEEE